MAGRGAARARVIACGVFAAAWGIASGARAGDAPRALVICAQCVTDADSAIESEVRAALAEHERYELLPSPALDFEAAQLSVDCTDESARCLKQVAEKLRARVLFVTGVRREKQTSTLRVLYFDSTSDAAPRSALRRHTGKKPERAFRAQLPELLRELIGKPEPASKELAKVAPSKADAPAARADEAPEPAEADADAPVATTPTAAPQPESVQPGTRLPLGPILLGGGGAVLVIAGIAVGAAMAGTEDDYAARMIDSPLQAELAEQERARGKNQALAANLLLGTGLVAVVAAGVWLALELREPEAAPMQTALTPLLGPDVAGVAIAGAWELRP